MSGEDGEEAPAPKRARSYFRKPGTKIAPEAAARQGEVTKLAFLLLGRDAAIAFLNTHNDGLDSRPIDLAVASAAGAATVEQAIRALAGQPA